MMKFKDSFPLKLHNSGTFVQFSIMFNNNEQGRILNKNQENQPNQANQGSDNGKKRRDLTTPTPAAGPFPFYIRSARMKVPAGFAVTRFTKKLFLFRAKYRRIRKCF
jgi:hypothetical protein